MKLKPRSQGWTTQTANEISANRCSQLEYGLEDQLPQFVKDLYMESTIATWNIIHQLGKPVEEQKEGERELSIIESGPWAQKYARQYMFMSPRERELMQLSNPDLVIRAATQEEKVKLAAEQSENL